jgi:CheY-like chemotaxis protein
MGKRILLADDSRTIQQAFAMVMDGSGYTLSFAKSVDEALAVARRDGRPDLVLSDAALGTGSGYDLCAQIKADGALRDVPVYILASAQTPYDEARGRKVGADGHLAKPFESQALLDAVASALAAPIRRPSAGMAAHGLDFGAGAANYGDEDVIGEDEDSYGEITIERGPAQAAANWAARPPTKPSGARPLPVPTPAPPSAAAPRPPMISTPRPAPAPAMARTGATPPPTPATVLPAPAQPRHTVMGFPAVRPPVAGRPGGPIPPAAPQVAAPLAPTPSRPATLPPATAAPPRPAVFATPAAPVAPVTARPTPPPPSLPGPLPGGASRPVVPRFTPPPPVAEPLAPQPSARRPATPQPATAPVEQPSGPISAPVTAVTDKIEQKIAALASRGPEFEAIAKLSREIIEQVVWEVVPELAEAIIRQQVDRLASAKK